MADLRPFVDPETGLKRQREQRPDGAGARYKIYGFGGIERYQCLAENCPFDAELPEQFDFHYFHKHERPLAQQRMIEEAGQRARERAERIQDRPEIPILNRF